jgi:ribosomal protein S18 acetylase RimI-like enzyme
MTNNTGHIVREARNDDIPALIGLLEELFSIEKDFFSGPEAQKRGLELLIRSADDRIFVAEIDKNVVGMCSVQILISTAEGGKVGLVEDVVVSKNYQGHGVGRTLMSAIDNYAKELGLSRLQLLADKNNHLAIGFYKNIGWGNTNLICLRR